MFCRQSLASLVLSSLLIVSQSRTVVHNVIVGSISVAVPGPKTFQNASTAQEVIVVTPTATDFEFRVGSRSDLPPFITALTRYSDGVIHLQCPPVQCPSYPVSVTCSMTPRTATIANPHPHRCSASNRFHHNPPVRHSSSIDSRSTAPSNTVPTTTSSPPRP